MDKVYVAKLGRAVGLKGWQKLYIQTDFPEQFTPNTTLYTQNNQKLTIEQYNNANDTIKFVSIDNIDEAKKLTNKELFVSYEETKKRCKLDENEFFWFDIVGCKIIEYGNCLGIVQEIQRMPLNDYLVIKTSQDLVKQKMSSTFLIPYDKQYIIKTDIKLKQISTKNAKDILEAS
jgi:16S rRNA processing protein RimM